MASGTSMEKKRQMDASRSDWNAQPPKSEIFQQHFKCTDFQYGKNDPYHN